MARVVTAAKMVRPIKYFAGNKNFSDTIIPRMKGISKRRNGARFHSGIGLYRDKGAD